MRDGAELSKLLEKASTFDFCLFHRASLSHPRSHTCMGAAWRASLRAVIYGLQELINVAVVRESMIGNSSSSSEHRWHCIVKERTRLKLGAPIAWPVHLACEYAMASSVGHMAGNESFLSRSSYNLHSILILGGRTRLIRIPFECLQRIVS